jgi:hypothetical protein
LIVVLEIFRSEKLNGKDQFRQSTVLILGLGGDICPEAFYGSDGSVCSLSFRYPKKDGLSRFSILSYGLGEGSPQSCVVDLENILVLRVHVTVGLAGEAK